MKVFDKKRVVLAKVKIVQLCNRCNNGLRYTMNAAINAGESFTENETKPPHPMGNCRREWQSHCDCMAGLGESCTHVASLLFAIRVEFISGTL